MAQKLGALLMGATLAACGGGGSSPTTAPPVATPTPPPRFEVVDGITDAPLTTAAVTPADPQPGHAVSVVLDGYLAREQVWTGPRIQLWPTGSDPATEKVVTHLAYGYEKEPLYRWDLRAHAAGLGEPVNAHLSEEDLQGIEAFFTDTFEEVASAGGPTFTWSPEPSGGLEVPGTGGISVFVDRTHECLENGQYLACTRWWHDDDGTITRAELVFDSTRNLLDPFFGKHMLGYALGLHDTSGGFYVMASFWRNRPYVFSEVERQVIHMMYQHRAPGNLFPDRDAAVGGTALGHGGGMREAREARPERWP